MITFNINLFKKKIIPDCIMGIEARCYSVGMRPVADDERVYVPYLKMLVGYTVDSYDE